MAPPKKSAAAATAEASTEVSLDSIQTILKELADIKTKLAQVDAVTASLANLKQALEAATSENTKLREENEKLREELTKNKADTSAIRDRAEAVERHQRSWSVRVQGVPLTMEEERDMSLTMQKVYRLAFEPILKGAQVSGAIRSIPDFEQLLESAHVLPGKQGSSKPIIARFRTRFWKQLCFRYRKDHASRIEQAGSQRRSQEDRAKYRFPFFDDLTKAAFSKLLEIQADPSVQSCWSINGYLRFKLKNSPSVRKVNSVFDPLNIILK